MAVTYEKVDDNTMNIITPVTKTVTLVDLRIFKSNAENNKQRYQDLVDKEQDTIDELTTQIAQAELLGIEE